MSTTFNQRLGEGLMLSFAPNAERLRSWLPTEKFCVRKPAAVFAKGQYWLYTDVVSWDNPHWPHTYDTSIHAFSSSDCQGWTYHGEVLRHRENGAWDFGGVATPGAVIFGGRIYLFYSGREKPEGSGWRQIGMAVADNRKYSVNRVSAHF